MVVAQGYQSEDLIILVPCFLFYYLILYSSPTLTNSQEEVQGIFQTSRAAAGEARTLDTRNVMHYNEHA